MKQGTKIGLAAFAIAVTAVVLWFGMTARVGLPDNRTPFVIAFIAAAALGALSFFRGISIPGAIPSVLAIVVGGFLTFTVIISPQTLDTAKSIKVGDTIPQFTALDGSGATFDSAALNGHLVLIKFFRAHW